MRAPLFLVATAAASTLSLTITADAQVRVAPGARVAVSRPVVASRPVVVSRPTVFIGGYYYPTLYRASLLYSPWYPGFYGSGFYGSGFYGSGFYGTGFYGPAYYQVPIYGRGRYYGQTGSVRLQVSPRQAEVFVDGYYAGTVNDFDGVFQRLQIEPGEHEIEIYLAGHRSYTQRFYLQPGKSFSIKHSMEVLGPGEATPARPSATAFTGPAPNDIGPAPGARGGVAGSVDGSVAGRGAGRGARGEAAGRGGAGGRGRGRAGGAAEGFGALSLRVQPAGAEVLIDGEPWQGSQGDEPLVIQLGAGTHHLEIRKEGYRTYLTDIPLGNGQSRTLNVSLTKQ